MLGSLVKRKRRVLGKGAIAELRSFGLGGRMKSLEKIQTSIKNLEGLSTILLKKLWQNLR